jgi:hypothetical protein
MTSVKADVLAALKASAALLLLVATDTYGNKAIYGQVALDVAAYPRVTFFELDNADSEYADDTEIASEITVQVDVWSKGSTTALAAAVDTVMKAEGFTRYYTTDLYEEDTKIYHKPLRYRKEIEL